MKILNEFKLKILIILMAGLLCLPFVMQKNVFMHANAESGDGNIIKNQSVLQINSTLNTSRKKNEVLIDKTKNDFFEGYIYTPKKSLTNENLTMVFSVSTIEIKEQNSLFLWAYIPSINVRDLVIVAYDNNSNSISWNLQGISVTENNNISLINMITDYEGELTRGWKLLELSWSDALVKGENITEIISIDISYKLLQETDDSDSEFAVAYPFIAEKISKKSAVIDHQDFVIYAEKESFLKKQSSIYMGDEIQINNIKDFFAYAIIGNQNILENESGYVWNVMVTEPSGNSRTLALSTKPNISFDEKGYYSLKINLTTIEQDYYSLIRLDFIIYSEPFAFGYFAKTQFDFKINTQNMIILTFSEDFDYDETKGLTFEFSDKNIATASYYIEDNKAFINVTTNNLGNVKLKVCAVGTKLNEAKPSEYNSEIIIKVSEVRKDNTIVAIWVTFGILTSGFVIYLIILFVKSRRFDVK